MTYRSPGAPPFSPAPPRPLRRIRCPSVTPAGIRTCMVLVDLPRPEPWQTGHGSSTTIPRPRHSRHGSVTAKTPPEVEVCIPLPSHVGQTRGIVPARAPVPRHASHAVSETICIATVTPSMACTKSTVTSPSTSLPRRGPRVVVNRVVWVVGPPLNRPPKISPRPPPALRKRSSTDGPPCLLPLPGKRKPPLPNSRRASSYSLRLAVLDSTSLASEISLKRCSAAVLPGF